MNLFVFLFLLLLTGAYQPAYAIDFGGGDFGGGGAGGDYGDADMNANSDYQEKYKGMGMAGSCTMKTQNKLEAKNLVKQSIDVNLDKLQDNLVNRIEDWGHRTAKAIATLSSIETNNFEMMKAEIITAMDRTVKLEQIRAMDQRTLDATLAMKPTPVETKIVTGLSYYRPELPVAFRQAEMTRYINELNLVPLDSKFKDSNGQPLSGFVDTSEGSLAAMGQEFRGFIRLFCDVRSSNGQVASTKFQHPLGPNKPTIEYWCGQDRGLGAPQVSKGPDGQYVALTGNALNGHILQQTRAETAWAKNGQGKISLQNAPKNVAELYFEPRSLTMDNQDVYQKAEQEFARLVIGRAGELKNVGKFVDSADQRDFMEAQARVAKLALARYPFAEMFSQKVPNMPEGSAGWAADLIEANLDGCKNANDNYKELCNLTRQLRAKKQISESEFFDVLFSRQFQGMAFSTSLVKMSEGQMKRLQTNLMGLQLALNYQRNRLKEQQLALMAAIYAQQAK